MNDGPAAGARDPRIPACLRADALEVARTEERWEAEAHEHHRRLTKPPGSLGRLEAVGRRLCAIQAFVPPRADPARVVVFAGDHGVAAARGVSPYPCEVTGQMVANFVAGGAAVNALAKVAGAELWVIEVGVAHPIAALDPSARFHRRNVAPGTRDMTVGPAMDRKSFEAALEVGLDMARACARDGIRVAAVGEMGIGNTTAASAITAGLLGLPPQDVVGPGTGADGAVMERKRLAIATALETNGVGAQDPAELLRCVGGLELAAICGFVVGAARHRIAVVLDGFISTASGAVAAALCPSARHYLLAGHLSPEPGHARLLDSLGLEPLLDLRMRLGEGSGAALALNLVSAAATVMQDMATFDGAGVSDRSGA